MFSLRLLKEANQLARRLSTLSIHNATGGGVLSATSYNPFHLQQYAGGVVDLNNNSSVRLRSSILQLEITPPAWSNGGRLPMVECPLVPAATVEDPVGHAVKEIMDKISDMPAKQDFELPMGQSGNVGEEGIQAAVLIGIRRRKMKKHKLKKLRKKMKFDWAKVRQRRELRKEKAFQAVLLTQIKEAEKFSAESYVAEKLRQANETPIPRFWKGRRLPEFLIREKLGLK